MAGKIAKNMLGFARGVTNSVTPNYAKKAGIQATKASADVIGRKVGVGLAKNGVTTGITRTIRNIDAGQGFKTALKNAHSSGGKLSAKKIAGTAFTVGVGGRIVTGGGLYKDRYGNTNLPGIPFI